MIITLIVTGLSLVILYMTWSLRVARDNMVLLYDKTARLQRELLVQERKRFDILAAITRHRNARGHDSCWLNDNELYNFCGLEPPQRCLPPLPEFLSSCARYYQEQAAEGKKSCSSPAVELPVASAPDEAGEPDCESCLTQCAASTAVDHAAAGQG
jgi:hypothetical protein